MRQCTDSEGDKDLSPSDHVRYSSTGMGHPTLGGLEVVIKEMHAPMNIREKKIRVPIRYRGDLGRGLWLA